MSRSHLEILQTGPLALIQDRGRIGHLAIGVGRSGAHMLYRFGPDARRPMPIRRARWPVQTERDWIPDFIPALSSHF